MASIKNILPSAAKSSIILVSLAILLLLNSPASCLSDSNNYLLISGQSLMAGGSLIRDKYRFTMQYDCNLVLYQSEVPIWWSGTHSLFDRHCYLAFMKNGELRVCTGANVTVWRSGIFYWDGYYVLVIESNGNLVVYNANGDVVWSSGTSTSPTEISGEKS